MPARKVVLDVKTGDTKKLYLDVCVLCRRFDDQGMLRIRLETDAVNLILEHVRRKNYELIVSPVHLLEIENTARHQERAELMLFLSGFASRPEWNIGKMRRRAEELHEMKFGLADAAHVAFAEASAQVFVTCDDRLLRKCLKTETALIAMNPMEFCMKEGLK